MHPPAPQIKISWISNKNSAVNLKNITIDHQIAPGLFHIGITITLQHLALLNIFSDYHENSFVIIHQRLNQSCCLPCWTFPRQVVFNLDNQNALAIWQLVNTGLTRPSCSLLTIITSTALIWLYSCILLSPRAMPAKLLRLTLTSEKGRCLVSP